MMNQTNSLLTLNNLSVSFTTPDGVVEAVNSVSASVCPGECLGIVGESGSGKSQMFLAAMGLLADNARATGHVWYDNKDLLSMNTEQINKIRGRHVSMIFQDPLTSLTPHLTIGKQMSEVLKKHQQTNASESTRYCAQWLEKVRIPEPELRLSQYPHELSGGMRQRVMIAMAMLCQPAVLIADEPTTALDVTIQADILDLMNELRAEQGTAIILITHDMGVVARMCDRVQVMQQGRCVEEGTCDAIFYRAQHPYTQILLNAVPSIPQQATLEAPP